MASEFALQGDSPFVIELVSVSSTPLEKSVRNHHLGSEVLWGLGIGRRHLPATKGQKLAGDTTCMQK